MCILSLRKRSITAFGAAHATLIIIEFRWLFIPVVCCQLLGRIAIHGIICGSLSLAYRGVSVSVCLSLCCS